MGVRIRGSKKLYNICVLTVFLAGRFARIVV